MLQFMTPWLFGAGAAAVSLPIIIHLLNRRKFKIVDWAAMEFLLEAKPPGIDIERDRCCLMDGHKRWSPDEFRRAVEWAREFFALWPEHVTTQLRERARESV